MVDRGPGSYQGPILFFERSNILSSMNKDYKYFLLENPARRVMQEAGLNYLTDYGHYNGYVVIPERHPLSKNIKKMSEERDKKIERGEIEEFWQKFPSDSIVGQDIIHGHDIDVNGGVTFCCSVDHILNGSDHDSPFRDQVSEDDRGGYILGFDTAHAHDLEYDWKYKEVEQETLKFKEQLEELEDLLP